MLKESLPSRFAPNFERRLTAQKAFEEKAEQAGEFEYINFLGDYSDSLEEHVQVLCDRLLLLKQGPIIVMDVGGGVGTSWSRLAISFENAIQNSRIAFVVSNMSQEPEELLLARRLSIEARTHRIAHATKQGFPADYFLEDDNKLVHASEELSKRRSLVHYVTGPFSELSAKTIILPDGRNTTLAGNVDILHECYSLTAWSLVPEVEILDIIKLASSYATYLVPKIDTTILQGDLLEEGDHIHEGIVIAHQDLQDHYGFTRTEKENIRTNNTTDSSYLVFRQSKSPIVG